MKIYTRIVVVSLILAFQGVYMAGFSQSNTQICSRGNQEPPADNPNLHPDSFPSSDVDIPSEAPIDPNEIIGLEGYNAPESTDTLRWVSATQSLAYTIYFENDADLAMAAASKVAFSAPLNKKNIRQI